VYTEEELQQMRKREAQKHHAQQLNILTSDNCPKKHPFDFRYGELNEIKRLFPEHKQKAKIKKPGQEVKIVGLDIKLLQARFIKLMNLNPEFNQADK